MLLALATLALATVDVPPVKNKNPVVCRRDRSFATGSHMRAPKVCRLKSEWEFEERHVQRELQSVKDKTLSLTPAMPAQAGPD